MLWRAGHDPPRRHCSAPGDGWLKSAGNCQGWQGRLLSEAASKNSGQIIQTVQFHGKRTEKDKGTRDRTRGYAQHHQGSTFFFVVFKLHVHYHKEKELSNQWGSRNVDLDNSKKTLVFTKGSLQKELEDFGLISAVISTPFNIEGTRARPIPVSDVQHGMASTQLHGKTWTEGLGSAPTNTTHPSRSWTGMDVFLEQHIKLEPAESCFPGKNSL